VTFSGWVASNRYYRWNGATHAFGLGVYEANFPIAASRFAREARLQPHLYNDLSAGGYLTWAQPVADGVFIDGRLEVYDTEFFSYYRRGLEDLSYWYDAARKYDIRSVIIFHRWPNRHGLIRRLAQDPRWRLVHKDEVAVVFAPVTAAADLAPLTSRYAQETASRLRQRRAAWWQYPGEQAVALRSYADLNLVLGDLDTALAAYDELLELGVTPAEEAEVRYRYAVFLARRGDANRARLMLERARSLLPADERVARLLDAIGTAK
jgi:tetratricopeptide (TPR) repeat protein